MNDEKRLTLIVVAIGLLSVALVSLYFPFFWLMLLAVGIIFLIPHSLLGIAIGLSEETAYRPSLFMLNLLLRLPRWYVGLEFKGQCLLALSSVSQRTRSPQEAIAIAERALELDLSPESWASKFKAYSIMGLAFMDLNENERAVRCLNQAWELFATNKEVFEKQGEENDIFQAENFDALAQLAIQSGELDRAADLYRRSSNLRRDNRTLKASADAYQQNSCATIELARGNTEVATELVFNAARQLPEEIRYEHAEVGLRVLSNLARLDVPLARDTFYAIYSRMGDLHPSQKHQLDSDALMMSPKRLDFK